MAHIVSFMNGTWGRLARSVLGLALIASGLTVRGDTTGLVLLGLGLSGHCVLEPFGGRQPRTS